MMQTTKQCLWLGLDAVYLFPLFSHCLKWPLAVSDKTPPPPPKVSLTHSLVFFPLPTPTSRLCYGQEEEEERDVEYHR